MMKYVFESKEKDELIQETVKELNVSEEELYYQITELESGKLFKSKKFQITAYKKEDIIAYIKEFIKQLSDTMDLEIAVEIRVEGDNFQIQLVSSNNAILIGKDGRTLNAIQVLLKQAVQNNIEYPLHIHVDASNYRAKQEHNFEYEMKKLMKEVQRTKMDIKLEPMNSYQRRMIHNLSNKFDDIETYSTGEGKERYITIAYKEK
ncbi:MAG: KH domain-containing protein [Firmicutes bacterium]|nr:KH domain-containing protein [Bacillota bacterium]